MAKRDNACTRFLSACLTLVAFTACSFSSKLELSNETTSLLTPYPVVTTPPPPHRQALPSGEVPPGKSAALDPEGFNPLFFAEGISLPALPNAVHLGFDFYASDPPQILVKLLHYPVMPGQEGNDPALQPSVLSEELVEITDENHVVRVFQAPSDTPGVSTWKVQIAPAP